MINQVAVSIRVKSFSKVGSITLMKIIPVQTTKPKKQGILGLLKDTGNIGFQKN